MIYTVIEQLSLDRADWMVPKADPDVREWDDPVEALLFLLGEIDCELHQSGYFRYFAVIDGKTYPSNALYEWIFGAPPVSTDRGYAYPKLKLDMGARVR